MKNKYIFRQIKQEEIDGLLLMIKDRMKWMDEKGIKQWNVTKYDEVYPWEYFEEKRLKEEVMVLEDSKRKIIVSAAVLRHEDERWAKENVFIDDFREDEGLYLHNFLTRVGEKGIGSYFLELCEKYTYDMGRKYMRLDSATDNDVLKKYYDIRGYVEAGKCIDGLYEGILKQKKIK